MTRMKYTAGFTLVETLVAITFLIVAIVAPMSLVSQSLSAAFYARDQMTAYNLAQEGIESVRAIRDGNILENVLTSSSFDLLRDIPIGRPFTIDARESTAADAIGNCPAAPSVVPCDPLQTDGTLYGYARPSETGWTDTVFTRTLTAAYVGAAADNGGRDVIRVSSTVSWNLSNGKSRTFTISENMYRWIEDGAADDD